MANPPREILSQEVKDEIRRIAERGEDVQRYVSISPDYLLALLDEIERKPFPSARGVLN